MQFFFILLSFILISCSQTSKKEGQVTIFKQWHPSPKIRTTDLEYSKTIPQYENQKDIYSLLKQKVAKGRNLYLLVEGCEEKEISQDFDKIFNGWDMTSLKDSLSNDSYDEIITLIPMKLEAKYPMLVTPVCSDNEELMTKTQLALSDARGFLGFHIRLKQNINNKEKFKSYHKSLEKVQGEKVTKPIEFTKTKSIESLQLFESYVKERNKSFVEAIKNNLDKNPIIIIGGLHVKDLTDQLANEGIKFTVITPKGYPESSETLTQDLLKALEK